MPEQTPSPQNQVKQPIKPEPKPDPAAKATPAAPSVVAPATPTPAPAATPKSPSTSAPKTDAVALIEVVKGGETLQIHPTTVAAHVAAGWRVARPASS